MWKNQQKRGRKQSISLIFASCLIVGSSYQATAESRKERAALIVDTEQLIELKQADVPQADIASEDIAQTGTARGTRESLSSIRSRLTNLEALPLFLPAEQGTLESADDQLSPTRLSQPSFSWIRDQVAIRYTSTTIPIEIVSQWQTYTTNEGFQYLDVIVNEARWERLNYLRRYGFVIQFGTVARDHGYQLRIFHTGDAANRNEALSAETSNGNIAGRSVRVRGAYFCTPNTEATSKCGTFITP